MNIEHPAAAKTEPTCQKPVARHQAGTPEESRRTLQKHV